MPKLLELERRARYLKPEFRVFIVQPGLSRKDATAAQQHLLATTELYLLKSYGIGLTVIGSA
ncbi:MAG: hypothetical protein Q8N51_02260 [Gammaproteobacteria bacterium]|nr:hypothetical protein [Gammaproteobacteria bacterium]